MDKIDRNEANKKIQQVLDREFQSLMLSGNLTRNYLNRIRELEARVAELEAVVERLPKTEDGVPLYLGMQVYWPSQCPTTTERGRTLCGYGVDVEDGVEGFDENDEWIPFDFKIFSTRKAAEDDAAKHQGGK